MDLSRFSVVATSRRLFGRSLAVAMASVGLAATLASGPASAAMGDIASDLVYVPVTPCRIADTRVAGGVITQGATRGFDVTAVSNFSFQGGDATNCGIGAAGSFAAVALNITVVSPTGDGYVTAFPFGTTMPLAATMLYKSGVTLSNFAILKLDQGASANEMSVFSTRQTHVVIDVVGYFTASAIGSLSCVTTAQTTNAVAAGGTSNAVAPACDAGYSETATYCSSTSWDMPFVFVNGGTCSAKNNGAGSADLRASRRCCRTVVP